MLTINTYRYNELPEKRRDELRLLASNEFDQFPIVRQTSWATPDWSFLGMEDQEELACFYNIVERIVRFNDKPVKVAGLNNLVTAPGYKRRGLASQLLSNTEAQWFSALAADYGLLLCAENLIPFYQRLGWHHTSSEVRFMQDEQECAWAAECMILSPTRKAIDPAVIDLCGLPW